MSTRIITGIVGILIATMVIQYGSWLFAICGYLLAAGAWREYARAFRSKGYNVSSSLGYVALATMLSSSYLGKEDTLLLPLILFWSLLALLLPVLRYGIYSVPSALAMATGIIYIGAPFSYLVSLRYFSGSLGGMELGCAMIWLTFIGTWASDTFAYFAGSFFGRHKLCPLVSPKKTWEGFIGGLLGTGISLAVLGNFLGLNTMHMFFLGLLLCLLATLGDLVESIIKRYVNIKDSGNLIPGHGGIWDRFDSILYTAPLVFYFTKLFFV